MSQTGHHRFRSRSGHRTSTSSKHNNTTSNNIYNGLPVDPMDDVSIQNTDSHQISSHKIPKPPPVTVFDINIVKLTELLKQIKDFNYNTTQVKLTQHGIKIHVINNTQHVILCDFLNSKHMQYYTHSLRENKRVKICLYGLWNMNAEELKKELNVLGIVPVEIKILEIRNKKYADQCIYLLYFLKKDGIRISGLRKTFSVFNCVVRWEYYSPKIKGPTQCSRCQDYGHGSENCKRNFKCVRCGDTHQSSLCPHLPLPTVDEKGNEIPGTIRKIPVAKVKCANCGKNHTANFKFCPAREKYINIQQNARSKLQHDKGKIHTPHFSDPNQFPNLPGSASHVHNNWQNNLSYARVTNTNTPNNLLSSHECYQIMNEFINKLSQCQSRQQQIQVIGEITFKYLYESR